ncbi:hypothetical protein CN918_27665 [Priestia megaterium]|nr:hypothetical protein CN918_27665 [Priestia megaterium]
MMSSSNHKISAKNVRVSEHSKVVNDKFFIEEEVFEEMYIKEKRETLQSKYEQMEKEMYESFQEKRRQMVEEAYEEGKERAVSEAEERISANVKQVIDEANRMLQEANQYRKEILENASEEKNRLLQNNRQEIIDMACNIAKQVVQNEIRVDDMNIEKMYEDALQSITYDTKKVIVKIHPVLRPWLEKSPYYGYDTRLEYFYDLYIQPGDIFIETDREYIDASMNEKIERLKESIKEVLRDDSI